MAKNLEITKVVCAVCGREIPPNPANGIVTNCVWVDNHYECMECRRKPAAKATPKREDKKKVSPPPKPSTPPPKEEKREEVAPPPKKVIKKPTGWDW